MALRIPSPKALTKPEAYLAYKAGILSRDELKQNLYNPLNNYEGWLAKWCGLLETYPTNKDGTPQCLTDEEGLLAYLCGVTDRYPASNSRPDDARISAYIRYLVSARYVRPDHPLNREEFYLSIIKTQFIPSGDPSSDIVIDGTAKAPFVDVKMYGDTVQNGTPTPEEPVPIQTVTGRQVVKVESKNLLNPNGRYAPGTIVTLTGVRCSFGEDGSITLDGTMVNNNVEIFGNANILHIPVDSSKRYYAVVKVLGGDIVVGDGNLAYECRYNGGSSVHYRATPLTGGTQVIPLDVSDTEYITRVRIYAYVTGGREPASFEQWKVQIAIYEEYNEAVYWQYGSSEYEINLGKNLFDIATASDVWISPSGIAQPNNLWKNSGFIKVEPNTTYVLSGSPIAAEHKQFQYHEYSSNNESSYINQYAQINGVDSTTFTTHTGCKYIRVGYRSDVLENVQLELGSTATSYAPYFKPIRLSSRGDKEDYIYPDGDEWKLHKDFGEANTLDTDIVDRTQTATSGKFRYIFGMPAGTPAPKVVAATDVQNVFSGYCSGLRPATRGNTYSNTNNVIGPTDGNFYKFAVFYAEEISSYSLEQALEWLHEKAFDIVYELETPTDTVITNQALIDQLNALKQGGAEEGTTYIKVSATDPNLPAKLYVEAPKYD